MNRSVWSGLMVWLLTLPLSGALPESYSRFTTLSDEELIATTARAPQETFSRSFEELVKRRSQDAEDPVLARIEVRRVLADYALKNIGELAAASHLFEAILLAQNLADADLLIPLHLARARLTHQGPGRENALESAREAWLITRQLGRAEEQIEAGLLYAEIAANIGAGLNYEPIYEEMLALPEADRLTIALHWAERSQASNPTERWTTVATLAQAAQQPAIQARALDRLGVISHRADAFARALTFFQQADQIAPERVRSADTWRAYVGVVAAAGNRDQLADTIASALTAIEETIDPDGAAALYEARSDLLAEKGDLAAAYHDLRYAQDLRRRRPPRIPLVTLTKPIPLDAQADAAALAAVRNALREAELASTRQQRNTTVALSVAALLLAFALAVAYHFKRRAAAALVEARDVAELRAERTRWQMLRYQLNPHFLFNALTSLSGLVLVDPRAAREVIGRLSRFCRYALERTTEELRAVDDEIEQITAFLDVEKAGLGDRLRVTITVDPAVRRYGLPPLLLQPLVENALKYGAITSGDLLEIRIEAQPTVGGDGLLIEVANTGDWIAPSADSFRRNPIGLNNVRERLARFTSAAEALTTTFSDGWVRVRVRLPVLDAASDLSPVTPAPSPQQTSVGS